MADVQEGKLYYFTAEGEPLPEGIDHEDTRIAFQLRGEDAKRKAKEWQKARDSEARIQSETEAKAIKAQQKAENKQKEKPDNKAETNAPDSKGEQTPEPQNGADGNQASPDDQDGASKPGQGDDANQVPSGA